MRLTPRERQVLRGVVRGLTYAQIAVELGITTHTVRTHVHAVLKRNGQATAPLAIVAWMTSEEQVAIVADALFDKYGGDGLRWRELVHEIVGMMGDL